MNVTVLFSHTSDQWIGRLSRSEKGPAEFSVHIDKKPEKQIEEIGTVKASTLFHEKEIRHFVWNNWPKTPIKNDDDFRKCFLLMVRDFILRRAATRREIVIPTNYSEEIWTKDHIVALSARLQKKTDPKKYSRKRWLEQLLIVCWKKNRLCDMTRDELCDWVNAFFPSSPWKAGTVWQTAYRCELFTARHSGPKPKT